MPPGPPSDTEKTGQSSDPQSPSCPAPKKRGPGRPRKAWDDIVSASTQEDWPRQFERLGLQQAPVPNGVPPTAASAQLDPVNTDDMEVLHHYMTHTSRTLHHDVWHDKVPLLAFRFPAVLHLMLALSATHMARLRPHDRLRFQQLAERYWLIGLRDFIPLVPDLNQENCDAAYISSILLYFVHLAKEPGPGPTRLVGNDGLLTWWYHLRGKFVVMSTMGLTAIFAGVLGPQEPPSPISFNPHIDDKGFQPRWEQSLEGAHILLPRTADPKADMYNNSYEVLWTCFFQIYGRTNKPKVDEVTDELIVLEWMDNLSQEFLACLDEGETASLILLAHYAILLKKLEFMWYMRGWGERVLHGVEEILDGEHHIWLRWPREEIARLEAMRISKDTDSPRSST